MNNKTLTNHSTIISDSALNMLKRNYNDNLALEKEPPNITSNRKMNIDESSII
jgi:hypothetical protein